MKLKGQYSPGEQKVLSLLKTKPQTSTDLCRRFYAPEEPAYHGRQIIVGLVTSLAKKTALHRERFRVMKTARAGPNPISCWIEERA
jgi:hypothetical protein